MASYPSSKIHRVSRRRLGRGQHVQVAAANVTPTVSTTTVTLVFDVPVVVNGPIPLVLDPAQTPVSQEQVSATEWQIHYPLTAAAASWSIDDQGGVVKTFQGGGLAVAEGTF